MVRICEIELGLAISSPQNRQLPDSSHICKSKQPPPDTSPPYSTRENRKIKEKAAPARTCIAIHRLIIFYFHWIRINSVFLLVFDFTIKREMMQAVVLNPTYCRAQQISDSPSSSRPSKVFPFLLSRSLEKFFFFFFKLAHLNLYWIQNPSFFGTQVSLKRGRYQLRRIPCRSVRIRSPTLTRRLGLFLWFLKNIWFSILKV